MKFIHPRFILIVVWYSTTAFSHAQPANQNAQNMYNHVYWQAWGQPDQSWGAYGLDYIGYINDTIQHAIAVGQYPLGTARSSSLCLNRFPLDTAAAYRFPGTKIFKCRFNDDSFPDYVVVDIPGSNPGLHVLFGTSKIDSFVTKYTIPYGYRGTEWFQTYVFDCDSDGYSDILLVDNYVRDSSGKYVGTIIYLRGGPNMDTTPAATLIGSPNVSGFSFGYVGGVLFSGKFLDTMTNYLAEARLYSDSAGYAYDSLHVIFYREGKGYHLMPTDSVSFIMDSTKYFRGAPNPGAINAIDVDGDGMQEICVKSLDKARDIKYGIGGVVLCYQCGPQPSKDPAFLFHSPFTYEGGEFGDKIIDVGDVCGQGYHSVVITDFNAHPGDGAMGNEGAAYLFNIGKGYKDSCIAYADGVYEFGNFASNVIATGDLSGDGLADFIITGDESDSLHQDLAYQGHLVVFTGDPTYATPASDIAVREQRTPTSPQLRCYPNPVTRNVVYLQYDLQGQDDIRIEFADMLGRIVQEARAPGSRGLWRMNLSALSAGIYICRVRAGAHSVSQIINVSR